MKTFFFCVFLTILMSNSACGDTSLMDDDYYNKKMIKHLNESTIWLIEEGVYTFNNSGKNGIFRKLLENWGVQLWVDPWIESERFIDAFWIKARGIHHDIMNFHRETYQNVIYEFWVVKVSGQEWADVKPRTEFFVTKTDEVYGIREILISSNQFIEEYQVDQDHVIYFPKDNLRILSELKAWLYPENYAESDLKDKLVGKDENGNISLVN